MQIATTDSDKLIADWQTTTPGASLTTSSQTSRNKPIVMFVIFKGCQVDARGDCNVTADFDAFDPSGKVYDHTKGARIWVGHPPPPNLGLQLSEAGYGLVIENKDPVGVYRVVATITDNLSGITLRTEQPFTVTP